MSKNTKHQKELLESKLNNSKKELNQLEIKYDNLILKLQTIISPYLLHTYTSNIKFKLNTNLQTLLNQKHQYYNNINTINTNNTNNTNNTITKLNYDYFNKEIILLEQEKKNNKQVISRLTKNNNELENNIKSSKNYIPDTLLNKIKNEELILKDELERINIETEETQQLQKITINKAYNNKNTLENDINLLKLEIKENNYSMEELKQYLHSSRKNIINQLIEKKQIQIQNNNQIINNTTTINTYNEQINNLNIQNKRLEYFKKCIIDNKYNNDENNNDENNNKLKNYYNEFNINIKLSFTEKINSIDGLIECNTNEINYIIKKMNKFKLMNDTIINKSNVTSSQKIITHKNEFKNYKEQIKSLEKKLYNLMYNYDNYETIIINKINKDFNLIYNELSLDKEKAYKRLHIVKERVEKERNEDILNSINTIKINKLLIEQAENNVIAISNFIKDLNFYITNEKNITKEINLIVENINKYKSIIHTYNEELKFIN